MDPIDCPNLTLDRGIAYFRPTGKINFKGALALIVQCLEACQRLGAEKLLINAMGLTGFNRPSTLQRFELGVQLARYARGMPIAVVSQAEWIDPERFGATVASNRGAPTAVFTSEEDAELWLRMTRPRAPNRFIPPPG